jgi:glucokinase
LASSQIFTVIFLFYHFSICRKKCSSLSIPIERVCSGPGIQAIYEFLIQENEDLEEEILKQEDISPELIVQEALKGKPLPKKALDIFIAALGSECSNLACKSLCYGGLYIVGSLVTAIKEYIQSSTIFWVINNSQFFHFWRNFFMKKKGWNRIWEKYPYLS